MNKKRSSLKRKKRCLLTKQQHRMISAFCFEASLCLFPFHLANELNCFGILLVRMISSSLAHKLANMCALLKSARTTKAQWILWLNVNVSGDVIMWRPHQKHIQFAYVFHFCGWFCFRVISTCVFCDMFSISFGLRSSCQWSIENLP